MDDGVREDYGLVIGELEGRDGEGDAIPGNNEQDDTADCTQETRVSERCPQLEKLENARCLEDGM